MIGFLSPSGDFYKCESWGHQSLATQLIDVLHIEAIYDYKNGIVSDEDILLEKGYICLRARDAFRSEWNR